MSHLEQFRLHACCCATHAWKAAEALWLSKVRELTLWIFVGFFAIVFLSGCAMFRGAHRAQVKATEFLAGGRADAPKDNGTPATVASSGEEARLPIPAGSTLKETSTEAEPATATTPARPAFKVRELTFSADSVLIQKSQEVKTSTGTIDTAVALRKVEAAEARWLLWAAIGCGIGGLVVRSMVPLWPGLSNGLFAGAVCAFIAWKFSDLPTWFFLVPIGLVAAKALGYKRAQWDADGDGVPDILQNKTQPPAS